MLCIVGKKKMDISAINVLKHGLQMLIVKPQSSSGQYSFRGLMKVIATGLSLTAFHCFNNGYVGKQQVHWKEYCAEYWLKELQESTGRRDKTEILLKTALNAI